MLNLKKTAVAVLALGSSAVFAGTMGPVCTPGNVTVPCERSAWDVGVYALYLQPITGAGWHYNNVVGPAANQTLDNYEPRWDWGFRLTGSYHFNTGNDLTINWSRIDVDHTRAYAPGITIGSGVVVGSYNLSNEWNQVDVELGQFTDFSANKKIRFHGGVTYSQIDRQINHFNAANVLAAGDHSEFEGAGPRTGIDMMYVFGNGFGVYAKGAASILLGTSKFNSGILSTLITTGQLNGSKDAITPELEAKLGAAYTYAMASGDLTLDLGWKWVDYVNALHGRNFPVSGFGTALFETDYALQGLEFGLHYVGNM
ncbi:MAG: hypothetical protein EPN84_02610 [Legionella sp.]|nr:MAG: hypothetical protein EPN84_02610 [Legionella sp.]